MKLKVFLTSALLVAAASYAATDKSHKTATVAASDKTAPAVSDAQVASMQVIMNTITSAENLSGPEELFKVISGETQTVTRELPAQGAVTTANTKGIRIVCYQEGTDKIVASTDPTLLGKDAADFKTSDGQKVRDMAIQAIRNSGGDVAVFTYNEQSKPGELLINGKPSSHARVVIAYGRNAFKNFSASDKKFICTAGQNIAR